MTANEIINDVQCNITYMTDNAQGIAKALYELAQCDDLIGTADMDGDYERKSKVRELLRTHDTCARLVCVLSDTLDGIMKELDRLDGIQLTEPAPAAEPTEAQLCDLKEKVRELRESFDKDTAPAKGGEKRNRKKP